MTIAVAIIALSILIVVHEFGHFIVARWCGMKVYEFSIGFGPKLFSYRGKETEFSLRVLLFGGYVRIAGMSPDDDDADVEGGFLRSPLWKKLAMVAAGPIANYVAAALLLAIIFIGWGVKRDGAEVKEITSGAVQKAGLKAGDVVLSVDGQPFPQRPPSPIGIISDKLSQLKGKKVSLTILRAGEKKQLNFPFGGDQLGIKIGLGDQIWIKKIDSKASGKIDKLQPGDLITFVGDSPAFDVGEVRKALAQAKDSIQLKVRRGEELLSVELSPDQAKEAERSIYWRVERALMIREVSKGSIAQAAGLKVGDILYKIGDTPLRVQKPKPLKEQFALLLSNCWKKPVSIKVSRGSQVEELKLKGSRPEDCRSEVEFLPPSWIRVIAVIPGTTAEKIGLKAGDKIVAVNGVPTLDVEILLEEIRTRLYRPISLTVVRNGKVVTLEAPMASFQRGNLDWKLGFRPQADFAHQKLGLLASLNRGVVQTWNINNGIIRELGRVITGEKNAQLTGPVGIVKIAKSTIEQGMRFFFFFLALISIHLAIFNLLPIPALDGGRIISAIIVEIVTAFGFNRDKIYRVEAIVNVIAFFLMFLLLIVVTFRDIFM